VSLAIFCDAPHKDEAAWNAFVLAHFLRHGTIRDSINGSVTASKIDNITIDNQDWMLDHAQEHLDTCNALNIQASPYIGETDMKDPSAYSQWMYQHRLEHDQFDKLLGL
jgi:hypothetical protein